MTPLQYAKICARDYADYKVEFLRGKGHVARVLVDVSKPWMKYLPRARVVVSEQGGIVWYTSKEIHGLYLEALLAAGVGPDTCKVVYKPAWDYALVRFRLDQRIVWPETMKLAAAMAQRLGRQQLRAERQAQHELDTLILSGGL